MSTRAARAGDEEHAIVGVATSTTLFIGDASSGPLGMPVRVSGAAEALARFGPIDSIGRLTRAAGDYFANGGSDAWLLRLAAENARDASAASDTLRVDAALPGIAGNRLRVAIVKARGRGTRFRIDVREGGTRSAVLERFDDLSSASDDARFAPAIVEAGSTRIRIVALASAVTRSHTFGLRGGSDGLPLDAGDDNFRAALASAFAVGGPIDSIDFSLLCVPGLTDPAAQVFLQAQCATRRAFYIADTPPDATAATLAQGLDASLFNPGADHSAFYAPWVLGPDSRRTSATNAYPPSAFVAGIYARTDAARGVWKAPSGSDAQVAGASGLALMIVERDNARLAALGINALRNLPGRGIVVWGARTVAGADGQGSEWKYVNVTRLSIFIERSIARGLQWAVFEPSGKLLWARVRRTVEQFLLDLWSRGALAGSRTDQAFFVHCDRTTMTQDDIDNGRLVMVIGIAPLKPAEFVIIRIGAWAQYENCKA